MYMFRDYLKYMFLEFPKYQPAHLLVVLTDHKGQTQSGQKRRRRPVILRSRPVSGRHLDLKGLHKMLHRSPNEEGEGEKPHQSRHHHRDMDMDLLPVHHTVHLMDLLLVHHMVHLMAYLRVHDIARQDRRRHLQGLISQLLTLAIRLRRITAEVHLVEARAHRAPGTP